MRKRYFALIVGVSLLALSGCSKKEAPAPETTTAAVVVESPAKTPETPTETSSSYTNKQETQPEDLFRELSDDKDTTLVKNDSDVFRVIQKESPDKYSVEGEYIEVKNEDYLKAVEETREAPISESVETNGIKALESNPEDASTFESFVSEEEANAFYSDLDSKFPGLSEMDRYYILDLEGVSQDALADYCKRWSDADTGMRTGESYKKCIAYKVVIGELEEDWCVAQGADRVELNEYINSIQGY